MKVRYFSAAQGAVPCAAKTNKKGDSDNEVYISTIVDHLDKVDQTDFGTLWRVAEIGDVYKENLQILFETNSKVANFTPGTLKCS